MGKGDLKEIKGLEYPLPLFSGVRGGKERRGLMEAENELFCTEQEAHLNAGQIKNPNISL